MIVTHLMRFLTRKLEMKAYHEPSDGSLDGDNNRLWWIDIHLTLSFSDNCFR